MNSQHHSTNPLTGNTHAPAARSPDTTYVQLTEESHPAPTGSPVSYACHSTDVSDLPFHLCNNIDVQDSIKESLNNMFASNWPMPTDEACKRDPTFCKIYSLVKEKNLPNALGARVLVPSGLNIQAWINMLSEYHDSQLCHFLAFGWPIGYYSTSIPKSVKTNHPSATAHPAHVHNLCN